VPGPEQASLNLVTALRDQDGQRRCRRPTASTDQLSGVTETLLEDPRAIEVAGRLRYDFTDGSRGAGWHAVRVATFDDAIRRFLNQHPAGPRSRR
jgi:hypothetical protein